MLGKKKDKELELSQFNDDEIAEYVIRKRSLREKIIELITEDVEDALQNVLVNAIKTANERTPLWWQWVLLMLMGALGGIGIGLLLAVKTGIGTSVPPPP